MHAQKALVPSRSDDVLPIPTRWMRLLVLIYFFAGVTSIAYEVLWVRMLGLQFGASIFGVVITVAAFMAGLGGGSLLGAIIVPRFKRPLLLFAALEAAVAVYAWTMPALFRGLDTQLGHLAAGADLEVWHAWQAGIAFTVLFVPALAMGLGFPAVLRVFTGTPIVLAKVYGLNTLGGALGALLPLVLLPALGWTDALRGVVILGLCVAGAAAVLAIRSTLGGSASLPAHRVKAVRPACFNLLMYGGIGAAALMLEVGWTRLYGMILLRTEYVLAITLCVFLIGIGAGSLWVRARNKVSWLVGFPIVAAGLALVSLWGLPVLAAWADQREYTSLLSALLWQGAALALLTVPVTLLFGAWLPLLSNHMEQGGRVSGAWLYGANSLGAAAGALIGGFILIPWVGTSATIVIAAAILLVCGVALARAWWALTALPLLALLAFPVISMPPVKKLLPASQPDVRELALYEDALAITHVVEQTDGQRLLLADLRRMDASSDPTAVVVQQNQARLPLMLHPAPQHLLFLGVGTGISAAGALALPGLSLTGIEISQGAILAASQWFAPVNDGVMEKMQVVRDDARRYLRINEARYDIIVGDLFHPDLVGRGNLLSLQQFERARARLAPGGIFVQWVALNQFDVRALRIVLRTFKRAYPQSMLFVDGFRLALVGFRDPMRDAPAIIRGVEDLAAEQRQAVTGGEAIWTWLGRYWGPVPAGDGLVEDEWRPHIEFLLPRARYSGDLNLSQVLEYLLAVRPDIEQAAAMLRVELAQLPQFERAYVATELVVRSWQASLSADGAEAVQAQRLLRLAYEANQRDRWIGFSLADQIFASLPAAVSRGEDERKILHAILAIRPDHIAALKALGQIERKAGHAELANEYFMRVRALSPLDRDVRTHLE